MNINLSYILNPSLASFLSDGSRRNHLATESDLPASERTREMLLPLWMLNSKSNIPLILGAILVSRSEFAATRSHCRL